MDGGSATVVRPPRLPIDLFHLHLTSHMLLVLALTVFHLLDCQQTIETDHPNHTADRQGRTGIVDLLQATGAPSTTRQLIRHLAKAPSLERATIWSRRQSGLSASIRPAHPDALPRRSRDLPDLSGAQGDGHRCGGRHSVIPLG